MPEVSRTSPAHAVHIDDGTVSAAERSLTTWPMADAEHERFGAGLERVAGQYRAMTPVDVELTLIELEHPFGG